jgi:hypothetical protein
MKRTKKQVKQLTIAAWERAVTSGDILPSHEIIMYLCNHGENCTGGSCPLGSDIGGCHCCGSYYDDWVKARNKTERIKCAKAILERVKNW